MKVQSLSETATITPTPQWTMLTLPTIPNAIQNLGRVDAQPRGLTRVITAVPHAWTAMTSTAMMRKRKKSIVECMEANRGWGRGAGKA
jgi:hypothetical protein